MDYQSTHVSNIDFRVYVRDPKNILEMVKALMWWRALQPFKATCLAALEGLESYEVSFRNVVNLYQYYGKDKQDAA